MLNGALLHDMIRGGGLLHPVEFARHFYAHYPAISLPYHPPMFPLFEAILYFLFGVGPAVARVAVAITVAASALLLYALIFRLNGSAPLAFLTTITFFALRISRDLASDVMLEFPALVLTLAALYGLRRFDRGFSLRTGIMFALLGGAAVWTKQTAIGLVAVPWVLILLTRRWGYLRQPAIWISSALLAFLDLVMLAVPVVALGWTGVAGKTGSTAGELVVILAGFYLRVLADRFSPAGLFVLTIVVLWTGVRVLRRREGWLAESFYLAWIIPIVAVALVTPRRDERYILGAYPAMVALGYLALFRAGRWILPEKRVWLPCFAAALSICCFSFAGAPEDSLKGVRQAAQFVESGHPARILYCGHDFDGDFLVQLRTTDPVTPATVVRAEQLPQEIRTAEALDEFAHRFGIDRVILERSVAGTNPDKWAALPTAKMELDRQFPVFNRAQPVGRIEVYRFTDPVANPPASIRLRSQLLSRSLDLEVEQR